jgi:hypothetical protein
MKEVFGLLECEYCAKRYTQKAKADKHRCELMERDEFIRDTKRGRFVLSVYKKWLETRGFQPRGRKYLIEAKYYNSLVKFAEFYYEVMLPDLDDYLAYVVSEGFLPQMWTNATVYERYMTAFDNRVKPLKQADITFKYLDILARQVDCTPAELFQYIQVQELAKLIQCRRLSPWVLLASEVFLEYMDDLDSNERAMLEMMVNEDVWLPKFRENPKERKRMLALAKELGI